MLTYVGALLIRVDYKCDSAPPLKIFLLLCIFSGWHTNLVMISPIQSQLISRFVDGRVTSLQYIRIYMSELTLKFS